MSRTISLFLANLTIGGAEQVAVNLSKGFSDAGYDVEFVLVQKKGALLSDVPNSVDIVELEGDRVRWCLVPLARYLRSKRSDALISFLTGNNTIAITASKLANVDTSIVVTEHSIQSEKKTFSAKRDLRIAKYIYNFADDIVGVSNGVVEDIASWTGIPVNEMHTIYNPVIAKDSLYQAYKHPSHPWYHGLDVPVILSVGRHTEEKDYPMLIRAFSKLLSKQDARLVLIGGGELTSEYEELATELGIANKISLPGFKSNPYPYMSHADIFVLSSRVEGLPTVLIEAMSCGTSVVSTNCQTGPAEILEKGKYGSLVPVGEPAAMANAIIESLDDPVNHDLLRERARDFTIRSAVEEYQKLL